jgi:hypothetical protein
MKNLKLNINYKNKNTTNKNTTNKNNKNIFTHIYIKCKNINYKYKKFYKNNLIIEYNFNTKIKYSYLLDGTNKIKCKTLNYNVNEFL